MLTAKALLKELQKEKYDVKGLPIVFKDEYGDEHKLHTVTFDETGVKVIIEGEEMMEPDNEIPNTEELIKSEEKACKETISEVITEKGTIQGYQNNNLEYETLTQEEQHQFEENILGDKT